MRRLITVVALTAGLSGTTAFAADFQTIGTMGMGGAGVARDMGSYAPYWNPAGLAFATKTFSSTIGAGVGLRVSDGLADNVDRIGKFTEGSPSTFDKLKNLSTLSNDPAVIAEMVSLLSVIRDIETQKGTLSLNADAALGVQVKSFGFGVFALNEGYGRPLADLTNVLPASNGGATQLTTAQLVALAGVPATTQTFFNATQTAQLNTALTTAGIALASDRTNIINALGNQLASPANPNLPTVTPQQATDTFVSSVAPAFSSTSNINNNQTAVLVKNVLFTEIPLSYGHAVDMGTNGKLGLGASIKPIIGRVYQTRIRLTENGQSVTSKDIVDGFKDNFEESTNITLDLGLQYKYANWLTLGLVGKNLTSPTFKSPALKDQKGRLVQPDGSFTTTPFKDADVTLKPQARAGLELAPLNWLTFAADLDLTENESILSGLEFKNRQLGGGVELSPLSWFKLRAGMYKNLADSSLGNVATAGLTFGIPWVLLEVDGAYGLKTAKYKGEDYPRESRVQVQLVMQF
jgi:hypothetical protein